jgi:hypothetical protein
LGYVVCVAFSYFCIKLNECNIEITQVSVLDITIKKIEAGFVTLVEHFVCETLILCKTSSPIWEKKKKKKKSYIWQ